MRARHLAAMIDPARVALVGASARPGTVGEALARHLVAEYRGVLDLVNPAHAELFGRPSFAGPADLPEPPDLAVVASPPDTILAVAEALAARGARSALIITDAKRGSRPAEEVRAGLAALAARSPMRICGPNALGLAVPALGLHATFAELRPRPGAIAFVGQSATAAGPLVDWANARGYGFSHIVSLGDMVDVDYADIVDASLADPRTRAIVVFAERLPEPRPLLSAIRAASRVKPVIVLKSGARERDGIYDAALRRAGALRVRTLEELFNAIAALLVRLPGDALPAPGPRLAIVANGESIGALAEDTLIAGDGTPARLSPVTIQRLGALLPPGRPRGNPVDILPDALPDRLERALAILFEDTNIDAVLVVAGPTGLTSTAAMAEAVARAVSAVRQRPGRRWPWVMVSWPGGELSAAALPVFAAHHIPCFETPSIAVRAFLVLTESRRIADMLRETPRAVPESRAAPVAAWRAALDAAAARGTTDLEPAAAGDLLAAFGLTRAEPPPGGLTFTASLETDPEFGPVLGFGFDGALGTALGRDVRGLPPLTHTQARDMLLALAPLRRLLAGGALGPEAADALASCLVGLAELTTALPDVAAFRLTGLHLDRGAARYGGARVTLADPPDPARLRFAIRPYPDEWVQALDLGGERYLLRPIRAEDQPALLGLLGRLSPEDLRLRFFQPLRTLDLGLAARLTQLDYDREMAFGLFREHADVAEQMQAVVRLHRDRRGPGAEAEFAITVASTMQKTGVGTLLMERILAYARASGLTAVFGLVLAENTGMLRLAARLGFTRMTEPGEPGVVRVVKTL